MIKWARKHAADIFLLAWVAFATLFIFFYSSMDYVSSHSASSSVTDIVYGNTQNKETIGIIVRKAAHMLEYAFLGISVFLMSKSIYRQYKKSFFGTSLFYTLAVAVADEHIQSYSDRTSSTGDIILDFCGAVIGFFVGWIIIKSYTYIKHLCKRKHEVN